MNNRQHFSARQFVKYTTLGIVTLRRFDAAARRTLRTQKYSVIVHTRVPRAKCVSGDPIGISAKTRHGFEPLAKPNSAH